MNEKYQYQPELTAVALGYSNKKLIADQIFPKVVVTTQSFEYLKLNNAQPPRIPDTKVGNKGKAQTYDGLIEKASATAQNHAIKDAITNQEAKNFQSTGRDLRAIRTLQLVEVLKTSREIEVAQMLSNTSNYANGNTKTLGDDEKIGSEESEAVDLIEEYKNKVLGGANTMVISRDAFSKLRRDRSIINSISINTRAQQSDIPGMVSVEAIKDLFMLDNIFIGETQINQSAKGATPTIASVWQNDIALLNINSNATNDFGITYGYSAIYQDFEVYTYEDNDAGLNGAEIIRPSASYIDLVAMKACGALLKSVI